MQMKNIQIKNTQRCQRRRNSVRLYGVCMSNSSPKHPARIAYLVAQILGTCGDVHSTCFYAKVARMLPDGQIFRFLSEIRQDPTIRNRGAVFTAKVQAYVQGHELYCFKEENG